MRIEFNVHPSGTEPNITNLYMYVNGIQLSVTSFTEMNTEIFKEAVNLLLIKHKVEVR